MKRPDAVRLAGVARLPDVVKRPDVVRRPEVAKRPGRLRGGKSTNIAGDRGTRMAALALASTLLALASASATRAADAPLSVEQQQGQKLFRNNCFYCHGEKVWGTLALARRRPAGDALLEKRADLTPQFVRTVVRNGLGSMPAYRRTELNDEDVDAIVAYLTTSSAREAR